MRMSDTLPEASTTRRASFEMTPGGPWICAERASHVWVDPKVKVWNPRESAADLLLLQSRDRVKGHSGVY